MASVQQGYLSQAAGSMGFAIRQGIRSRDAGNFRYSLLVVVANVFRKFYDRVSGYNVNRHTI
ncbi:hypothetical protein AB833_31105 [Chromatiales bacterium (ex Bugula neritina AB1)]|nr:hypothetical protein AB833_31105 [Chromatiales bacterium (ex Bugula neritina AB1)]